MGTAALPWTEIFFSLPEAKNAIHFPSGEKKEPFTPSVPARMVGLVSESKRVASCTLLPTRIGKAIRLPSGERTAVILVPLTASGPRSALKRQAGRSTDRDARHHPTPIPIAATTGSA